jgi:hypothetical protein
VPETTGKLRLCPHPDYETVTCPACRADIRGVVPVGTSADPAARCPACETVIDSVLTPE